MSPATPKDPKPANGGSLLTTSPTKSAQSMRTTTLTLLVVVVVVIAATMVGSAVRFVLAPDAAVKAGPMYVVLALMTVASLLMALLAINSTFLRVLTRRQVADVSLVMWTTAVTGTITGILTLGGAVNSLVMRLLVGTMAYAFIWMQSARLAKARAAQASGGGPAAPRRAPAAARPAPTASKSRQRRGGRKR